MVEKTKEEPLSDDEITEAEEKRDEEIQEKKDQIEKDRQDKLDKGEAVEEDVPEPKVDAIKTTKKVTYKEAD